MTATRTSPTGPTSPTGRTASALSASDVHLTYGSTPALRGASLTVPPGAIVALVGPSGSGKTTLLHCLAGLIVPDSGTVCFGDVVVNALSDDERTALRRDSFGFVLQFGHLVPDLTLVENVAIPLLLRGTGRREAMARAREAIGDLSLRESADRHPADVSGGQQQRAAVARALVGDPSVVFADEPTGALDVANGDRVMDLLTSAARERGASVVLVTHDTTRLSGVDRVVSIVDGRMPTEPARVPGHAADTGSPEDGARAAGTTS